MTSHDDTPTPELVYPAKMKTQIEGRLRRMKGQVQGLYRMVNEPAGLNDVYSLLLQITAAEGALQSLRKYVLVTSLRSGSESHLDDVVEHLGQ